MFSALRDERDRHSVLIGKAHSQRKEMQNPFPCSVKYQQMLSSPGPGPCGEGEGEGGLRKPVYGVLALPCLRLAYTLDPHVHMHARVSSGSRYPRATVWGSSRHSSHSCFSVSLPPSRLRSHCFPPSLSLFPSFSLLLSISLSLPPPISTQ